MTDRNLPEKQARPRVDAQKALRELAGVVNHYRAHNDRFERWLNERDEQARERQRARFVGLSDDVRRELGAVRS